MKNILYIGNKLHASNTTVTTIDTLSINLKNEGYNVISASNKKQQLHRLLDMLFHIVKYKKKTDYVLIDTYSTLNFYYAYLSSLLCRIFKLKYIPILHGGNLPKRLKKSPKLSKAIFNNAYINVAPSAYTKHHFEEFGINNITCIPNSIQLEKYPFKKRKIQDVKLLWVRSFSKIYNPELAVKILKALENEGIKASLCMVGPEKDGSMNTTKALAEKLNVEVRFTNKLSKKAWVELSKNYTIFINTTYFDNMPVSVIEAMALGLPVISTNVGGIPYLIKNKENGFLVEADNTLAFVEAIKFVINNPNKISEVADNALKTVKHYNWNVVKHAWFKVLT